MKLMIKVHLEVYLTSHHVVSYAMAFPLWYTAGWGRKTPESRLAQCLGCYPAGETLIVISALCYPGKKQNILLTPQTIEHSIYWYLGRVKGCPKFIELLLLSVPTCWLSLPLSLPLFLSLLSFFLSFVLASVCIVKLFLLYSQFISIISG